MIFCARATRGLRRPSLDARSGRSISPHPLERERASLEGAFISFDARNRGSTRLPCGERGERTRKGERGTARPSFLLAEAARSECAPSMRAVKDSLAAPLKATWRKFEGPRWTRAGKGSLAPPCKEDVCLEAPQIVHCAISRVDTYRQRVVAFPEFPTATD